MILNLQILSVLAVVLLNGCTVAERVSAEGPAFEKYLVVSFVPRGDAFDQASSMLAKRHHCKVLHATTEAVAELLPELRKREPDCVAIVVHPDDLDINLVSAILDLSTRVDEDPFVDFQYGFITGRNSDAAVKLVRASDPTTEKRDAKINQFGVAGAAMPASMKHEMRLPMGQGSLPMCTFTSKGHTDKSADRGFIKNSLPKLERSPILLLASHGYPDGLVGGLKAADLEKVDLSGTIALNLACYNGVTGRWYENDWSTMTVKEKKVAAKESFCLSMIDSGVAGYVAYACPRPAGPTLFGDAAMIATQGTTLGEQRRGDNNSVVLAHLLRGNDQVVTTPYRNGDAIPRDRTPGSTVARMSVGGMLIGDPAYSPFSPQPKLMHKTQRTNESDDTMTVDVSINTPMFHFFAGEQINYWQDQTAAMRLETVVEIGDRYLSSVALSKSPISGADYKLVAAVENHRGKRMLHVKAVFAQPEMAVLQRLSTKGFAGQFTIKFHEDSESSNDSSSMRIFRSNGPAS